MKLETNLSLSGAMRRGHEIYPRQIRTRLYGFSFGEDDGGPPGACALGHALGAAGYQFALGPNALDQEGYGAVRETWPISLERVACPCACNATDTTGEMPTVCGIVHHLNDHHLWSVDQIADWVAEQERKLMESNAKKKTSCLVEAKD